MVLQVKRKYYGKTWWFELEIPQEHWEDLFHADEEQSPESVAAAYARANLFWDRLAEDHADRLKPCAVPVAADRHMRQVWVDNRTLGAAYRIYVGDQARTYRSGSVLVNRDPKQR